MAKLVSLWAEQQPVGVSYIYFVIFKFRKRTYPPTAHLDVFRLFLHENVLHKWHLIQIREVTSTNRFVHATHRHTNIFKAQKWRKKIELKIKCSALRNRQRYTVHSVWHDSYIFMHKLNNFIRNYSISGHARRYTHTHRHTGNMGPCKRIHPIRDRVYFLFDFHSINIGISFLPSLVNRQSRPFSRQTTDRPNEKKSFSSIWKPPQWVATQTRCTADTNARQPSWCTWRVLQSHWRNRFSKKLNSVALFRLIQYAVRARLHACVCA